MLSKVLAFALLAFALPIVSSPKQLYMYPHAALLGFQGDRLLVQRREGPYTYTLLPELAWLDARSGKVRRTVTLLGTSGDLHSPILSPDGTMLALNQNNTSSVSLWRLPNGQPWPFHISNSPVVHSLTFDTTGRFMALGRAPGYAQVWDLHTGRRLRSFVGHGAPVSAVSLAAGRLLSAGLDGTVRVWETTTGEVLADAQIPGVEGERAVSDVVLTPDGQTYLALTTQGSLWLGRIGREGLMQVDVDNGRGLALNAVGNLLVVGGHSEHGVALVDLPSGRVRTRLRASRNSEAVAFAPSGDLLAAEIRNPYLSSDVEVISLW